MEKLNYYEKQRVKKAVSAFKKLHPVVKLDFVKELSRTEVGEDNLFKLLEFSVRKNYAKKAIF